MRAVATVFLAAIAAAGQQTPDTRFDAASIRPHKGDDVRSGPLTINSPLIRLEGYTLYGLILDAFDLRAFQISWPPRPPVSAEDIAGVQYDIVARSPGDGIPATDRVRAMLRNLLGDRFRLATHFETRATDVYMLESRLKSVPLSRGGAGQPCSVRTRLAADGRNDEQTFTNCSVGRLAEELDRIDGRPVLDRTGISGVYNFRFIAIPDYRARDHAEAADIDRAEAVSRLGLKLTRTKAPVQILVIDHVEKPTPN